MREVSYYSGREQTYLKHFFLEKYLERVAYVIGYNQSEFVYIDGFSGPWRSADEAFEDTSFVVAINILRRVRDGLASGGKRPRIRCLFIEKDPQAFAALQDAVGRFPDLDVTPLNGDFETLIPTILRYIRNSFSLVFIDPTGWTGFGLRKIEPILKHRPGEVLINFMFDYINRFLDHPDDRITASFDDLFGGPGWDSAVYADDRRENAILELYCDRMRGLGRFEHVARTRILKPTSDRSYFYLVYGTRHVKGLREFRGIEKKVIEEQERVRSTAKQTHRVARTGQSELFAAATLTGAASYEQERQVQLSAASEKLLTLLRDGRQIEYENALAALLERPYVWESDVKALVQELRRAGQLKIVGMKPRERTPKEGHVLVPPATDAPARQPR
ncbi:MAG: three-Cys-motif partner protein TcmP [Deltaproteobacteria bacterium]|nr:three-Cys-motif partner protein TcmP [Deltaproteobacteria bacterium]